MSRCSTPTRKQIPVQSNGLPISLHMSWHIRWVSLFWSGPIVQLSTGLCPWQLSNCPIVQLSNCPLDTVPSGLATWSQWVGGATCGSTKASPPGSDIRWATGQLEVCFFNVYNKQYNYGQYPGKRSLGKSQRQASSVRGYQPLSGHFLLTKILWEVTPLEVSPPSTDGRTDVIGVFPGFPNYNSPSPPPVPLLNWLNLRVLVR